MHDQHPFPVFTRFANIGWIDGQFVIGLFDSAVKLVNIPAAFQCQKDERVQPSTQPFAPNHTIGHRTLTSVAKAGRVYL